MMSLEKTFIFRELDVSGKIVANFVCKILLKMMIP